MGTLSQGQETVPTISTGAIALAKRVTAAAGRLFIVWNNYRGLAMLARMDDHALADIGLSRTDVKDALSRRWWEDPTETLNERRGARRPSHHQSGAEIAPPLVPDGPAERVTRESRRAA